MMKLYIISCFLWLYAANIIAQNVEKKDSVLLEGRQDYNWQVLKSPNERDSTELAKKREDNIYPLERNFILPPQRNIPANLLTLYLEDNIVFHTMPIIQLFNQNEISKSQLFIPYSYSFDSMIESVIIKGFQSNHSFTDYLSANLDIYVSKHHFGNIISPYYYINGSVRAQLLLNLTDRIQVTGEGQLSLREGIDPKIPSLIGGANYYGAGMQIKITNKVGIGVGFTNNYYRGEWAKRSYIAPVGY